MISQLHNGEIRRIVIPGDPEFYETLYSYDPPTIEDHSINGDYLMYGVCSETGLLKPLDDKEYLDYVYGGEYDEVIDNSPDDDDRLPW